MHLRALKMLNYLSNLRWLQMFFRNLYNSLVLKFKTSKMYNSLFQARQSYTDLNHIKSMLISYL